MNDLHFFKLARESSLKSDYTGAGKAKIGCIAVYNGSILAKGFNTDKTHTKQATFNKWRYKEGVTKYLPPKAHAEIVVCQKIKYLDIDFSKVHLFIYRETKDGNQAMSRCCPACIAAVQELGIKHIHYTSAEGYVHEVLK